MFNDRFQVLFFYRIFLFFSGFIMSAELLVASLVSEAEGATSDKDKYGKLIESAVEEVTTLLEATQDSMEAIYTDVESASTKRQLKEAFGRLNGVWGIFLGLELSPECEPLLLKAISALNASPRLSSFLATASSASSALTDYKGAVMSQLATTIRKRVDERRIVEAMDEELFSRFLPEPSPPCGDVDPSNDTVLPVQGSLLQTGSGKRPFAEVEQAQKIPKKKSRIPALASFVQVASESTLQDTPKKKVLMTREKLRAGLLDPRGLLDLSGSSTNALEHMKRLELLKAAGVGFDSKASSSFAEKLNAAIARLDLGLGGHSLSDSLLFGAKALSAPRSLSTKNISDIEYNAVDGKTSWSHQNLYAKIMIAGCLNQSRRIIEKFDEVLFGPAPEAIVETSHREIRTLLFSEECRNFLVDKDKKDEASVEAGDNLIKKIVEAVGPVVPISLRNRSLDGGYLRTALYLLGASEFLFSQYEADVRVKANPAGLVGMCSAMHAEIERSVLWQQELRGFSEFMKDMRSQYQTSLGLGVSFSNDASRRQKKRSRSSRGRSYSRGRPSHNRFEGFPSGQNTPIVGGLPGYRGRGRGTQIGSPRNLVDISSLRSRGICFDYRSGSCGRGEACRFLHSDE